MIETADFDIYAQLHEKMLNKALAMAFYAGKLNVPEQEFNLVKKKIAPASFAPFSKFKFEVTLTNEPFIDLTNKDSIFIRCGSQLKLNLFDCVDIYFTLDFNIAAVIRFNSEKMQFEFELNHVKILDIGANHQYYISDLFKGKLNHIIYDVLDTYYRNQVKTIDLNNLKGIDFPQLKSKFSMVKRAEARIFDNKSIVAGVSFFGEYGNLAKAKNCLNKADCYVAVSENAAKKILDYCWANKAGDLKTDFEKNSSINFASGAIAQTTDTVMRVITLGFIETNTDYDNMELLCNGNVSVGGTPTLNFTDEGEIEILNLEFNADVNVKIEADQTQSVTLDKSSIIPDSLTKFEDDVHLSTKSEHKVLVDTHNSFVVKVEKASALLKFKTKNESSDSLIVDGSDCPNDGSIVVKIKDVDFKVEFDKKGTTFSDATWEKIMKLVKSYIIDKIPEFTVSPALILSDVKVLDRYNMYLCNSKLDVADNGFAISTDVNAKQLDANEVAIPNYIVDMSSNVVHSFECNDVYKIRQGSRAGYYVMYEALAKGFKPCAKCLKGYSLAD